MNDSLQRHNMPDCKFVNMTSQLSWHCSCDNFNKYSRKIRGNKFHIYTYKKNIYKLHICYIYNININIQYIKQNSNTYLCTHSTIIIRKTSKNNKLAISLKYKPTLNIYFSLYIYIWMIIYYVYLYKNMQVSRRKCWCVPTSIIPSVEGWYISTLDLVALISYLTSVSLNLVSIVSLCKRMFTRCRG